MPTRIILAIAPINAFLNWYFGIRPVRLLAIRSLNLVLIVYSLGLGFRGAPIATSLSFNLVSLTSIVYAYLFAPRTAWIPLGSGIWSGWGLLARLSIAGIGESPGSIGFPNVPEKLIFPSS